MSYKLVYIAEGGLRNTVFDSQVFLPLRELKRSGVNVHLSIIELFDVRYDDFVQKKLSAVKKEFGDCTYMRGMPMVCRATCKIDSRRLRKLLNRKHVIFTGAAIHARGHFGAYTAINAFRREKVIADIRGLVAAEIEYYAPSGIRNFLKKFRIKELNIIEEFVIRNSAKVFCVSNMLKKHLLSKYSVDEDKIMVIPTLVDTGIFNYNQEARKEVRKKLGLENRIVFIYSGGLAKWQLPEKVLNLFKKLKHKIQDAFLIFLTHEPASAAVYFTDIKKDDYLLGYAPYEKIPEYLNAADIGFLLREDNSVNHVASPTKFGEYLCCGLPVLLTRGIGDTEEVILDTGGGSVIDNPDVIPTENIIHMLTQINRKALSEAGYKVYSIYTNIERIKAEHEKIV